MESRFDPTSCVLMICPEDYEKIDSEHLGNNRYYVVHGWFRLKALKQIDSEVGANTTSYNFCPCYIVETNCFIIQNYGFIRGNDLQSAFSSKPKKSKRYDSG